MEGIRVAQLGKQADAATAAAPPPAAADSGH